MGQNIGNNSVDDNPSPSHYKIGRLFDTKIDNDKKLKKKLEQSKKNLEQLWNMNKRVQSEMKYMNIKGIKGVDLQITQDQVIITPTEILNLKAERSIRYSRRNLKSKLISFFEVVN